MTTQDKTRAIRNLIIFTVAVYALGWLGRWLDVQAGGATAPEGPGILIWLVAPLGVSLVLRAVAGDGWRDFGLRPAIKDHSIWYLISILVYPACTLFVLLAGAVLVGAVSFANFAWGAFLQAVAVAAIPGLFTAIEELGWRGYLAPKVYGLGLNAFAAHAIVGLIWGGWHIPYFSVFWGHAMEQLPRFVLFFFLGAITHSIVYGEIRMQTGSVWPAFLMHAVSNAVNNTLLAGGFVAIASDKMLVASPGIEGLLGILFFAVSGVALHLWRNKEARPPA